MAASRQKDLRRRPVHPGDRDVPTTEKEVEISEILEDEEEDEYNDPLVLKGSRPKGPAKPLSRETEEQWGIEDDDNWGGGSSAERLRSGKEPQEQRVQRVVEPGNLELIVTLLVHLAILGFYVYVHVYDGSVYKKMKGKGFIGADTFGGRWKYLTYLNLRAQFVYFFLAFLHDIMPQSNAKQLLNRFCDFTFNTLIFPVALFVAIAFWGVYFIDRELIYPSELDKYIPWILNHYWHTTIIIGVFLELVLVFHRYPTASNAVATLFTVSTAYIVWIVVILTVDNFWVYPFLRLMPPPVISVFFAACFFLLLGLYFLGKLIGCRRWQERHQLMEELRL